MDKDSRYTQVLERGVRVTRLHDAATCQFSGPAELGEQLASLVEANETVAADRVEAVRESSTPLEEPLFQVASTRVSASEVIRIKLTSAVAEHLDSVYSFGRNGQVDPSHFSIRTHPELLNQTTRLFSKPAVALAYRFGYIPSSLHKVPIAGVGDNADFDVKSHYEFRDFTLEHDSESLISDAKHLDAWFDDTTAVTEFAEYATDDDIDWADYTEWFYTHTFPSYRLDDEVHKRDWSMLRPLPAANPRIKPRFESTRDPSIGDFIRYAILQHFEAALPSVQAVNTGPRPWDTDHVTLFIEPVQPLTEGMISEGLCPKTAVVKMARLGYRPVDGWIESPIIGHERDDPEVLRRIEFARGDALSEWVTQTLAGNSGLDIAALVNQDYAFGFDWTPSVTCLRSTIASNHALRTQTPPHRST